MRVCHYCGRANADTALFCAECCTPLKAPDAARTEPPLVPPLMPKDRPRVLNARSATIILLGYLAAKVFCGVLIEVIAAVSGGMEGIRNQGVDRMLEHLIPP